MNSQNAHLYIPLTQAVADKKRIQQFNYTTNEWVDLGDAVYFSQPPECYRIKPEPKRVYIKDYMVSYSAPNKDEVDWIEYIEAIK